MCVHEGERVCVCSCREEGVCVFMKGGGCGCVHEGGRVCMCS